VQRSRHGRRRLSARRRGGPADADVALFLAESEPRLTARGATLLEHAVANEEAIALIASVGDVLSHLLHEQLALAVRRARRARNPDTAAETSAVAVGFVDFVGSTRWAEGLTLKDHAVALARFESAAWDLATHHDGRLVKLIGDEAMFVAPAVTDACEIATEQCSGVERDLDLPPARGAVGFGKVLTRDGDYFGPLVNLVARAVKEAPPGTVVVTDDVVAGLGRARSDRVTTPIGKRSLRGIEDRVALHALG
jgi:class 3 adenylate cyclase